MVSTGSPAAMRPARETVAGAGSRSRWQDVDGSAAIVNAIEQSLSFQVGNVLVHGGQALEPHAAGNFLKRWGIPIAGHKRLQEVDDFFLPASNSHGRIIANKKRIAPELFWNLRYLFVEGR
jgi:hypothetical protein